MLFSYYDFGVTISPQDLWELGRDDMQILRELEIIMDRRLKEVSPKTALEKVTCSFSAEISKRVQEELRQRYEAVGWNVAISSTVAILRLKS